nr:DUF2079 domain-containing protein [Streptomyces sp. SID5468]
MADTSWDLGIFDEAVRHYAHFQAPVVDIKGPGFDILGDHFSPVLAVLAPVYRLFPGAVTLLIAQALLLGVSAVPLTRAAITRLGTGRGTALGIAYGTAWGLQRAADNGFHEIAFAVPLLAMTTTCLLDRRGRAAACWCLPLVLVKEDLGLTVAAVGALLVLRRERVLGCALVLFGTAAFAVTVGVLIPAMNSAGHYDYWSKVGGGGTAGSLLKPFLSGWDVKSQTLLVLFGTVGLLALRSPLCLLALPTLGWRFTATDTVYWGTDWHYSAVLMPIVFAALVDAVVAAESSPRRWLRGWAHNVVPAVLGIALTFTLAGRLPLQDLLHTATYDPGPRAPAARHALAEIPDNATVETNIGLMSHLTSRCDVFWVGDTKGLTPRYIALDLLNGWSTPVTDPVGYARSLHPGATYALLSNVDGYAVLRLNSPANR